MNMRNGCFFLVILLVSMPGCWGGKKKKVETKPKKTTQVFSEVNIPVSGDAVKSFFDEDIEEFVLIDNTGTGAQQKVAQHEPVQPADDFSWVEEVADNELKAVYFDFDRYDVRQDQQGALEKDLELVKQSLAKGEQPTVVIEGHACHSAGSRTYNLALSEKRAKVVADRLVAAGVDRQDIKIVARGSEVPAHDKSGKTVTGDREQQWPNRRGEVHIVYS